jgi:hypothetical protein
MPKPSDSSIVHFGSAGIILSGLLLSLDSVQLLATHMQSTRHASMIITATFLCLALYGCGGGASSLTGGGGGGGSGGGGGGGGGGLSISSLTPSEVMVGIPVGIVVVHGEGFSSASEVLVNGQPINTISGDSSTLEALIGPSLNTTVGTYQFSVQKGGQVSNSLPYTVYAPQQGPFVMQAIPGFLVGENERDAPFIVAVDVDGDGLADVVMPGPPLANSGSIAILRGQSDGTLAAVKYISCPTPYALAAGDVDGNGTADLVSITSDNSSSTTVSILFGDGHGNFQQPSVQQTFPGIYPGPAYLSDLDGDGKPDLVLAAQQSTTTNLVWLRNTGGGFAVPATLATMRNRNIAIADFNQDSKPDILYFAPDSSFHILLNQGGAQFRDQAAVGLSGVAGVPNVFDFNLDGIPDVVVEVQQSTGGQLVSFSGNGDGSFTRVTSLSTPGMTQLVSGDFDHDGFPDLAGPTGTEPSKIMYFFGDGHGNFVAKQVVGPEGQYAAVGDFNGDGIPDVVVPDRFTFVSLALGRTDRSFVSPLSLSPATVTSVWAGDINGDGLPEIFVGGNPISSIPGTVFLNQGNNSFQFAANTDPSSFMVADLTAKGVVDLLGGPSSNLEIWPNNGSLNFSASPITLPLPTANVSISDMDGDGHPDIVSACLYVECPGQILYGNGSYQFTPVTLANLSWPYIVGDFNGDGKLDIATGSATFLNTGGRTFQEVAGSGLPLVNGVLTAVGDFNGDGKDDVAINLPGDTSIAIYYSNGDGTFYEATEIDPGQEPGVLVSGDFNGDGRTDLAVGLMLSQQACLLFNNGNGEFTRSFFASGAFAVSMTTSDLNRDGKPDLIIGNFVLSYEPANVDVIFHK